MTREQAHATIQDANSSGQGRHPLHANHPLHATATGYGYAYSHTTPIGTLDGSFYLSHTYKHGAHTLSLDDSRPNAWRTSRSTASGHSWNGLGQAKLAAHLKSKARRYELPTTPTP